MKKIILITVFLLVALQFIPYGRKHSNPPVVSAPGWNSPRTKELFLRACNDCHSNETKWPWYSHLAPVSWMIQNDVNEGREHFNVSLVGVQKKNRGSQASDELREGEMPPRLYLIAHSDARLSENETRELIQGLSATFGPEKGTPGRYGNSR